MKINELKRKYKNVWVLAEVLKESRFNEPIDVKPILASKNRNNIYEKIAKLPKGKKVATLYTGKISGSFLLICTW